MIKFLNFITFATQAIGASVQGENLATISFIKTVNYGGSSLNVAPLSSTQKNYASDLPNPTPLPSSIKLELPGTSPKIITTKVRSYPTSHVKWTYSRPYTSGILWGLDSSAKASATWKDIHISTQTKSHLLVAITKSETTSSHARAVPTSSPGVPAFAFNTPYLWPVSKPSQASSTAVVIIPITLSTMQKRDFTEVDDLFQEDMTSTVTLKTTIVTDKLPSSATKMSTKLATISKSMPTSGSTHDEDIVTSILAGHNRCPYPYPGGECGKQKTTLVTKTNPKQDTTSSKKKPPRSSRWCPYPGLEC
ncbi:hypothetical protein GQ44DRAFT_771478 [Phaeosphaeriaceae sp. PMI808]|nr:hypothetical protein GQ44DRAFT_771478 [Phaeosphaeriaceae sp. PMI808]